MNKKQLIERIENLYYEKGPITDRLTLNRNWILKMIEKLDEPQAGHADEAPRYVRNVIARLYELPLHDREVWLKAIMDEFEQDFSHAKWREGYEQGKFEGAWVGEQLKDADKIRRELNKPVVQQFVADWYEKNKNSLEFNIFDYVYQFDQNEESDFKNWFNDINTKPLQTLVNMHQFGYEVEREKRYLVKVKGVNEECEYLVFGELSNTWKLRSLGSFGELRKHHTRKELEEAGFGWVFSCEGVEIEEVTE
jgi:phage protein